MNGRGVNRTDCRVGKISITILNMLYTVVHSRYRRHVGKTKFSIWRHSVDMFGWAIIKTNLNTEYAIHS